MTIGGVELASQYEINRGVRGIELNNLLLDANWLLGAGASKWLCAQNCNSDGEKIIAQSHTNGYVAPGLIDVQLELPPEKFCNLTDAEI